MRVYLDFLASAKIFTKQLLKERAFNPHTPYI